MPGTHFDSDQRLSLILETQQAIAAAGDDLESVMQVVAERSPAIIGADGAMVNLIDGDFLYTRAASGSAAEVRGARRPIAKSIARYAIESGQPLLVEDTRTDPRINQEMRGRVGDTSLICVPLFSGPDVIGTLNVMSGSETEHPEKDARQTLEMLSVVRIGRGQPSGRVRGPRPGPGHRALPHSVRRHLAGDPAPRRRRRRGRGQPRAGADGATAGRWWARASAPT